MENINRLCSYYHAQAEAFVEHIPENKRAGLSLSPYFESEDFLSVSDILRAFFGDDEAMQRIDELRAPVFSDEDITRCSINSGYLNPSQLKSVKLALSNNVTLIQGPPGTGKTEVILNILSCIRQLCPEGTNAAVLSTNNEALRNIHEKIDDEKDSNPQLAALYGSTIQLGSQAVRKNTFSERPDLGDCFVSVTRGKFTTYYAAEDFTQRAPFFTSTIHSIKKLYRNPEVGMSKMYDYVIVDECSQAGVMLGLIAMSCARRIILIGDVEQLAPVFNSAREQELRQEFADVNPLYMEENEKSFLEVCHTVFGSLSDTAVMLTGHYRCHPSIIGFNNKYVYNGMLEPLTRTGTARMLPAQELAIRVVWYEGDYFEVHRNKDANRSVHTNYRQLRILFEEEMPRIVEKLRSDPSYSVGIIAPYRSILKAVQEELDKQDYREDLGEVVLEEEQPAEDNPDAAQPFSVLTIHRSQGKGCNCIIFLSSEDSSYDTRWPWSQQKRMLNVAVSRAKNELCVITASLWLPEEFQDRYAKHTITVKKKDAPDEERDNLFLQKLLDYVYYDCAELTCREEYGFHRSGITSVFDDVPYCREAYATALSVRKGLSAPAICMKNALRLRYADKYDILCEVPLTLLSIDCEPNELRLDFAICSEDRVLAAVEVDGSYHRDEGIHEQFDRRKDDILSQHPGIGFVRAKTDGSDKGDIMEAIDAAINSALESGEIITIDRKEYEKTMTVDEGRAQKAELEAQLSSVINSCYNNFIRFYAEATATNMDIRPIIPNYERNETIQATDYTNENTASFYLCHFGAAYAFEYSMIFDIMLRNKWKYFTQYNVPIMPLNILSLGCGSMIDRWGLEYAIARLATEGIGNFSIDGYQGVDLVDWPVRVSQGELELGSIIDHFGPDKRITNNVIVFSKILNELDSTVFEELVRNIAETDFPNDEYYILFSHNYSKVVPYFTTQPDHGLRRSGEILNAIKEAAIRTTSTDRYSTEYRMYSDLLSAEERENFLRTHFANDNAPEDAKVKDKWDKRYVKMDNSFYSVGYYFSNSETPLPNSAPEGDLRGNHFYDYDPAFKIMVDTNDGTNRRRSLASCFRDLHKQDNRISNVMNRTSKLVFQVVKLYRSRQTDNS